MPGNLLTEWATLLLGSFADAGITDVVISPGSRSTPFVLAAARNARLRCHDSMDERAAAFFALGQARITGRPSLLICTSGTAAGHYLPAAIEAGLSHTPLVMLTSDRPFELQDCGASQTIDQTKMFGSHARAFFELGTPDTFSGSLRAVRRIAAQAVSASMWPLPGAVQVNARARKPLEPAAPSNDEERALRSAVESLLASPIALLHRPRLSIDEPAIDHAIAAIGRAKRGLIVAGAAPLAQHAARDALFRLASKAGFPILAEAASGLRFCDRPEGALVVDCFDQVLRSKEIRNALGADLILQVGGFPVSTGFERWVAEHLDVPTFVLGPYAWIDPFSRSTTHLIADVDIGAAQLADRLGAPAERSPWSDLFRAARDRATEAARSLGDPEGDDLNEGGVARALIAAAPRGSALLLGNSLAIRLVDAFAEAPGKELMILSQRGAAGIDGLISGAAGSARSLDRPLGLLIGDVSFIHDTNGLALAKAIDHRPLVIVVVQNRGGRIFEQLPIAKAGVDPDSLAHITTPHDVDLGSLCRGFGVRHAKIDRRSALEAALAEAYGTNGCSVIEAVVPESEAVSIFERLWSATERSMQSALTTWRAASC